jgi:hypothetical protein
MTNEKINGTPFMGENKEIAPEEAMKKLEQVPRALAHRSLVEEMGDVRSPLYRPNVKKWLDSEEPLENAPYEIQKDPEIEWIRTWVEEVAVEAFQAGIKFMIPAVQEARASHLTAEEV